MTDPQVPLYWRNETSGVLAPAVEAYLAGGPMSSGQIVAMRAYLRQWISAPCWAGPDITELRQAIDGITDRVSLAAWLAVAEDQAIDPL